MKGYFGNPEATAETVKDGWLLTGDIGYADGEGNLFIVDRKKDLIICSGFNVYPREIEEVLLSHAGVADAAVVGVSDPKRSESPYAFVIKKPGTTVNEDELIRFSNENLAAYKHIKHVEFVSEFPRNPNRKVLKRELRETAEKKSAS
jgi:long-chain acyl-CoA synthetase